MKKQKQNDRKKLKIIIENDLCNNHNFIIMFVLKKWKNHVKKIFYEKIKIEKKNWKLIMSLLWLGT